MIALDVASPAEMKRLGESLGRRLQPGDVIGLAGDLGAGKTVFVQGLAIGLGVPEGTPVVSPTFTLVNEVHGGRAVLHHVDLYRLEHESELEDVGLDDLYRGEGIVAVEWMDRFPDAVPADRLELSIRVTGESTRRIEIAAHGGMASRLTGWP